MSTTSTTGPHRVGPPSTASRNPVRLLVAGALVATLVNGVLWAAGRAADVSFSVTPLGSDSSTVVGLVAVLPVTLVAFAGASGLLVLAVRRSRTWVRAVILAAALVAVVSVVGPLSAADDTATGVSLAAMHLATGAVFVVTSSVFLTALSRAGARA